MDLKFGDIRLAFDENHDKDAWMHSDPDHGMFSS